MKGWLAAALAAMVIGGVWRLLMKLCVGRTGWAATNVMLMAAEIGLTIPLVFWMVRNGQEEWKVESRWWLVALAAGLLGGLNGMLVTWAFKNGPVGTVSMIHGAAPVVAVALGMLFLKERLNWSSFAGIGLVAAGLLVLSLNQANPRG